MGKYFLIVAIQCVLVHHVYLL